MSGTRWRIITWNLHGSASPDLRRIAQVIVEQAADVVLLQEVRRGQARTLSEILGWQHRWARKHHPYSPAVPWLSEGLAIMSPHRLTDHHRQTISPGVSTWTHRHRIVLASTVGRGHDRVRVYDTHLASGRAADERIAQARRVADLVRADPVRADPLRADRPRSQPLDGATPTDTATGMLPCIVGGDLNAPGEVEVIREFHTVGLRDPGGGPTNPSIAPRQRLDYVLVPVEARVTDQHEPEGGDDWWAISDHLPVTVEFELPE